MQKVGNRELVYAGKALRTSGGLRKKDLALSHRKIVSRKQQQLAKTSKNNLSKHLVRKSKIKKSLVKNG